MQVKVFFMATVILTFIILLIVVAGMAIGAIVQGKPIKGTCGGIASLGLDKACDICGGDTVKCEEENKKNTSKEVEENLSYDATKKELK